MISVKMTDKPLISVIVLSYNSSEFVLSTLESIKRQTYAGPVELIIGDDCSQDESVPVCEQWIKANQSRFARTLILRPEENQGLVANINSCLKQAQGEWIKGIAGDDILTDNALDILYNAAASGPRTYQFVNSAMYSFMDDEQIAQPDKLRLMKAGKQAGEFTLNDVFRKHTFWTNSPSFFFSKKLIEDIGYVPHLFRNIEDRPLVATVLSKGYSIYRLETPTVFYRNNPASISNTAGGYRFAECNWRTYKEILRPSFGFLRAIDMDLRMLPDWFLMKRKKKDFVTRSFKLGSKIIWFIYRALTFPFTLR